MEPPFSLFQGSDDLFYESLVAGAVATQMLEMMKAQGKGKDDFTIIATFYEDVAGVNISTGQRTK